MKRYLVTLRDRREVIVSADSYSEKDDRYSFLREGKEEQFFLCNDVIGISFAPDPGRVVTASSD